MSPSNSDSPIVDQSESRNRNAFIDLSFGANEIRLDWRQWGIVLVLVGTFAVLTPSLWRIAERFETDDDYRIPYPLSKDYWLYERRTDRLTENAAIVVVGDSVVWGEYVARDGTLSHFLNEREDSSDVRFVNAGVNGLFPLALEGLIRHYGSGIRNRKVILHANLLWMSGPEADLSIDKEQKFNHVALVPQFRPSIPCYRAPIDDRLGIVAERNLEILKWTRHLQTAYFDGMDPYVWSLADGGNYPATYPNAYRNPFHRITMTVPGESASDPDRGPDSPRHKPWSTTGVSTQRFEWLELEDSLQWAAFGRLIDLLRRRDNSLFIVVGPFNVHLMTPDNRDVFRSVQEKALAYFDSNEIDYLIPETLPSEFYGDASHPLTDGYALLAERIADDEGFRAWIKGSKALEP